MAKTAKLTLIFLFLQMVHPVRVLRCDFLEEDFIGRALSGPPAMSDDIKSSIFKDNQANYQASNPMNTPTGSRVSLRRSSSRIDDVRKEER